MYHKPSHYSTNILLKTNMAFGTRQGPPRPYSLADAPELQEYVLHDVTEGEDIGRGAFGAVQKLTYQGAVCAGKRLHSILLTGDGESNLIEKFVSECRLLKNLRHPHIVQFLGICFLPASDLPVMVMEYLYSDLHEVLETHPRIPIYIKLCVLCDIARGLFYLHGQTPPIVHRDLSARNVLLNSALVAKIADFGVARIINPLHLSRELTQFPGASVYMPPEAGQSGDLATDYSSKLDIFSLGVIFLFTITQVFPQNVLPATFYDENEVLQPRNEEERRQQYMEVAERILGDSDHPLLVLVRECLANIPYRRPSTRNILQRVSALSDEAQDDVAVMGKLQMIAELRRLNEEQQHSLYDEDQLGVVLREKEQELTQLRAEMAAKRQELRQVQAQLQSAELQILDKDDEIISLHTQLCGCQQRIEERERQLNILHLALQQQAADQDHLGTALRQLEELRHEKWEWQQEKLHYENQMSQLTSRVAGSEGQLTEQIRRKDADIVALRQQVLHAKQAVGRAQNEQRSSEEHMQRELREGQAAHEAQLVETEQQLLALREQVAQLSTENAQVRNTAVARPPPQPIGLQVHLPLTAVPTHSTPFGINSARAVMLGNNVVVAGGNADVDNVQQVMFYRQDRGWGLLGKYSLSLFAMAVLEGRLLLLVGGYSLPLDTYSSDLVQWDRPNRQWRPIFKPMPTPRSDAAALGYKQYLLVAGGSNGVENLSTVEVLDVRTVEWSLVAPLPIPIEGLIQSVSHVDPAHPDSDTWYLMGWEKGLRRPPSVFCISLEQLVRQARGDGPAAAWAQLPDPPLASCGAVTFRGCLLAVGGKDRQSTKKKDIYLYLPGTCEWLRVAELLTARHSCSCISLSSEEFLVIGGSEATPYSTRVDIVHT